MTMSNRQCGAGTVAAALAFGALIVLALPADEPVISRSLALRHFARRNMRRALEAPDEDHPEEEHRQHFLDMRKATLEHRRATRASASHYISHGVPPATYVALFADSTFANATGPPEPLNSTFANATGPPPAHNSTSANATSASPPPSPAASPPPPCSFWDWVWGRC